MIQVKGWLEQHALHTGSPLAKEMISQWGSAVSRFVKVIPIEYKRYLLQSKKEVRSNG